MRILGLDLGTNTGWATMERDAEGLHVHQSNCYRLNKMMELHGSVGRWIGFFSLLNEYGGDADFICYENVPPSVHTGAVAARVYGGLFATLELWAKEYDKPLFPISIQAAKKALCGTQKASKEMMKRAAEKRFPMIPIVAHDQADALGVCLAAFEKVKTVRGA